MKRTALALVLAIAALVLLSGCGDDGQQARVDEFTIALVSDELAETGMTPVCYLRAEVVEMMPDADEREVAEALWGRIFTSDPSSRVLDWWTERVSVCVG